MFRFFNKSDEDFYNQLVESYRQIENEAKMRHIPDERLKRTDLEVDEFDDIKMIHFPMCLRWVRFYGTWKDLHDRLYADFPKFYVNVQLYTVRGNDSGLII